MEKLEVGKWYRHKDSWAGDLLYLGDVRDYGITVREEFGALFCHVFYNVSYNNSSIYSDSSVTNFLPVKQGKTDE